MEMPVVPVGRLQMCSKIIRSKVVMCVSACACLQSRWVWGWERILEDRVFLLGRGQIFRTRPQDPWNLRACMRACVSVCVCLGKWGFF